MRHIVAVGNDCRSFVICGRLGKVTVSRLFVARKQLEFSRHVTSKIPF